MEFPDYLRHPGVFFWTITFLVNHILEASPIVSGIRVTEKAGWLSLNWARGGPRHNRVVFTERHGKMYESSCYKAVSGEQTLGWSWI